MAIEARPIPSELVKPQGFEQTSSSVIMRPTFGSIGAQYVKFDIVKEYSAVKSLAQGKEVKNPTEVCFFRNDRFTLAPVRVRDLSAEQKVKLAPLYERFKTQKDSGETQVMDWDAVSDMEKALLLQAGVGTVEQLATYEDADTYRLGPSGMEIRDRAKRHIGSKQDDKQEEFKKEFSMLMKEKAEQADRIKRLEDALFAREAAKAEQVNARRVRKPRAQAPDQIVTEEKAA